MRGPRPLFPEGAICGLVEEERLPASYADFAQRWIQPLAVWLAAARRRRGAPLLAGVNGAQGTGKTTLCKFLQLLLEREYKTITLSLDDFYLGRDERRRLAAQVHPLLATRGPPGTHDSASLAATLDKLLAGKSVTAPRFDKVTDDRLPVASWRRHQQPVDIVLLEGWCVGCPPQPGEMLGRPVNPLEADEDAGGRWRRYVNARLAEDYAALFARLHCLIMLQAPSLAAVQEWRGLQEQKLHAEEDRRGMDATRLRRFLQHYERLTLWCLAELPGRADYLLRLNEAHEVAEVVVK
ncbi:MAG: hypothetical protein OXC05_14230 [Halieaceae bacterium]|nr:hypothetical protein [Halieaceae bacterium]